MASAMFKCTGGIDFCANDMFTAFELKQREEELDEMKTQRKGNLAMEDHEKKALAIIEEREGKQLRSQDFDALICQKLGLLPGILKKKKSKRSRLR